MKKFKTASVCIMVSAFVSAYFMQIVSADENDLEIRESVALVTAVSEAEQPFQTVSAVSSVRQDTDTSGNEMPDGVISNNERPSGIVGETVVPLDDILRAYGEDVPYKSMKYGYSGSKDIKEITVFEENGRYRNFAESRQRTVTMKDGTFPPVQKIKEALPSEYSAVLFIKLDCESKNIYSISSVLDGTEAYDILMNDPNVLSIDETAVVYEQMFYLEGIAFASETEEEVFSKYGALGLLVPDESNNIYAGFCETENVSIAYIDNSVLRNLSDAYDTIKELCNDDNCQLLGSYAESAFDDERTFTANLYKAVQTGDVNEDGIVDMNDLTALSLALLGDTAFTERQIMTADINKNGKADLADLAKMKQYISKVISSFE